MVPVQLLVFAVQTAITTTVCIAEYLSWDHLSVADKLNLGYLYMPYLALCKIRFRFSLLGFSIPVGKSRVRASRYHMLLAQLWHRRT